LNIVRLKNETENTKKVLDMIMVIMMNEKLHDKYKGYKQLKSMQSISIN
jgi:hypothetical protein